MPYVVSLRELTREDISTAGGKGANLGELVRAGFPVPPGFVITTAAYDRVVSRNKVGGLIESMAAGNPADASALRRAFEDAAMPDDMRQDILKAYDALGSPAVAVRSSATAEDLPGAAFAGQQDTFLNVIGAEALLVSVRRCWASLWNDRAISYRTRQSVAQGSVKLAVVVQQMAPARAAGVMFTANPVTGARNKVVVEANPGLGEAVVSGLVTPDHYVLRKSRLWWSIREARRGKREVIVRTLETGGTEQVTGITDTVPAISSGSLLRLANYGLAIERLFGSPQDIEWVQSANGKLMIVQARPMTALPEPVPHTWWLIRLLSGILAEMFPIRPYPLDVTTWIPAVSRGAVAPILGLIGFSDPHIDRMFGESDGMLEGFTGRVFARPTPLLLVAPFRFWWLVVRYNPLKWRDDKLMAKSRARLRELAAIDPKELSWAGLLAHVRVTLSLILPVAGEMRRRYLPRTVVAILLLRVELGVLGLRQYWGKLLSGADSATVRANRAIESLSEAVRQDVALRAIFVTQPKGKLAAALAAEPAGIEFLVKFQSFLDEYGHRESAFSSVLMPTWKDAPEVVLGMVQAFAGSERAPQPERPAWEAARDLLFSRTLVKRPPFRQMTHKLLATARCVWQIREETHFNATLVLPILRPTYLEIGGRLRREGVVESPQEVFHLTFPELEQIGLWPPSAAQVEQLRAAVKRRKEARVKLEGKPVIDPRFFATFTPAEGDILLQGTPGSPGVAEGTVRVIQDASEFGEIRQGEVLVAPYTNPGWTPLFQRAIAVVADGGAAGSHAAIVAREYGIPAVMGTVDGTKKLKNGDRVRVDGSRGVVYRVGGDIPATKPDAQAQPRL